MTQPRTVADVLDDHVTLDVECIARMYLNLSQPKFQHEHSGWSDFSKATGGAGSCRRC